MTVHGTSERRLASFNTSEARSSFNGHHNNSVLQSLVKKPTSSSATS